MIVRIVAVLVAALILTGSAAAACKHPKTSLASLEGQVMCPTCHTTLDQSSSDSARRIEHFMQMRINQCASADQIKDELVQNFGAGILAAPSRKGFDLLAWWLPLGGIMLGGVLIAFGVWRWSRAHPPDGGAAPLDAETEQRLDELLARLD